MNEFVEKAAVVPIRFFHKYAPMADGSTRAVEWVEFAPRGMAKYQITPARWRDVERMTDGTHECLRPHYEAWRKGEELPESGTPLAAWAGVTKEQIDILKASSIKTVEDLAALPDSLIAKVPLPNVRALKQQAQMWDAAKDHRKVEAALAQKDDEIAALKAQMESLMEMMGQPEGRDPSEEPIKRRPGRPRKDEAEAA